MRNLMSAACVAAAVAFGVAMHAAQNGTVEWHVAAAEAAAGSDFAGVFNRICTEAVPPAGRGDAAGRGRRAAPRPPGPPARETWRGR